MTLTRNTYIRGWLQRDAHLYANSLMSQYNNPECARKIENWRTRMTHRHDVDKILDKTHNYRQAKQIVEYAKQYILPMINKYYIDNE